MDFGGAGISEMSMKPLDSSALQNMICGQVMPNAVNNENVLNALAQVNRQDYVPRQLRQVAYLDENISLGNGRTILSPMVLAKMLAAVDVKCSDVVLLVGDASGYAAAVLSHLAEAVVALEESPESIEELGNALDHQEISNVAFVSGDLCEGIQKQGPYNVIFINGGVEELPEALTDQLSEDGRLICIMTQDGTGRAHLISRHGDLIRAKDIFDTNVSVISCFQKQPGFIF